MLSGVGCRSRVEAYLDRSFPGCIHVGLCVCGGGGGGIFTPWRSIIFVVVTDILMLLLLLFSPSSSTKMFLNGGLAASIGSLLCSAWVACDNMIVLIHLAEKSGKSSYGQVWCCVVWCAMWCHVWC